MSNLSANILSTVLGRAIHRMADGRYYAENGDEIILTAAEQRAIYPLLIDGVPEWETDAEYAAAVTFEASRRNDALIPRRERELLYLTALTSLADAVDALDNGDPLPQSYADAKSQGLAVASAVQGVETAAATIASLPADARPGDYLALVAAFDSALA